MFTSASRGIATTEGVSGRVSPLSPLSPLDEDWAMTGRAHGSAIASQSAAVRIFVVDGNVVTGGLSTFFVRGYLLPGAHEDERPAPPLASDAGPFVSPI